MTQPQEAQKDVVYNLLKSRTGCIFDDPQKMSANERKVRFAESFFISGCRIPFISLSNSKIFTNEGKKKYVSEMRSTYFEIFLVSAFVQQLPLARFFRQSILYVCRVIRNHGGDALLGQQGPEILTQYA
jgi:hypothetical protein